MQVDWTWNGGPPWTHETRPKDYKPPCGHRHGRYRCTDVCGYGGLAGKMTSVPEAVRVLLDDIEDVRGWTPGLSALRELLEREFAPAVRDASQLREARAALGAILARVRQFDREFVAEPDDARLLGHGIQLAENVRNVAEGYLRAASAAAGSGPRT